MLPSSLLPLKKVRAEIVQTFWTGGSWLWKARGIVKKKQKHHYSLVSKEEDGKLCSFFIPYVQRYFFSPFFYQAFSSHLHPPVGCSLSQNIWLHTGSLSFQAPALIFNVWVPATATKAEICLFICLLDCWARAAEPHCLTCLCNSKSHILNCHRGFVDWSRSSPRTSSVSWGSSPA